MEVDFEKVQRKKREIITSNNNIINKTQSTHRYPVMTLLPSRPSLSSCAIILSLLFLHDTNAFLPQHNRPIRETYSTQVIGRPSQSSIVSSSFCCLLTRANASLGSDEQQRRRRETSANGGSLLFEEMKSIIQLWIACFAISILIISWEDISNSHPMRQQQQQQQQVTQFSSSSSISIGSKNWGRSTVNGMGFGSQERNTFSQLADLESMEFQNLPSYNEVMEKHRTERIPLWSTDADANIIDGQKQQLKYQKIIVTRENVVDAVRTVQLALLKLQECKQLAQDYEWEKLATALDDRLFQTDLAKSCYVLKQADSFLSQESREVIGFDWGSCAWRHCGALADAQEALDEITHLIGVLEPFECAFCLDIVERSLRDILDMTKNYQDASLANQIPAYQPIQRMSDVNEDNIDGFDAELMDALSFFRRTDTD